MCDACFRFVELGRALCVRCAYELGTRAQRRISLSVARRVVQAVSPKLSGRATALVVLLALLGASLSFPLALHRQPWLEIEAVLAAFWCILSLTIGVLLFRGFRLHDDLFFYAPSFELARRRGQGDLGLDGCGIADLGCADAAGCDEGGGLVFAGLLVVGVVVLATLLSWLVVEAILPLAFLAFYMVLMAALKRAARDRHDCQGQLRRALGWAMAWASVYIAPLAVLVYALHRFIGS
jgi:hypothetical protein